MKLSNDHGPHLGARLTNASLPKSSPSFSEQTTPFESKPNYKQILVHKNMNKILHLRA